MTTCHSKPSRDRWYNIEYLQFNWAVGLPLGILLLEIEPTLSKKYDNLVVRRGKDVVIIALRLYLPTKGRSLDR